MMSWEKARYQGRKSEDVDVTKERLRVESNNDPVTSKRDEEKREDVVIIKHLTKFYNWKKVIVIPTIFLSIILLLILGSSLFTP